MLRTRPPVRPLTLSDADDALALCARDIVSNVFVAARILEGVHSGSLGTVLGHRTEGVLDSICWASANIVPVESDPQSRAAFAERVRRWRSRSASVFGAREQVMDLWELLESHWGEPRAIRRRQPLMSMDVQPSTLGIEIDERVRLAAPHEIDLVLPAAAHMFTHEIGYRPYRGSARVYRNSLMALISRRHTYVVIEGGEVVFKTDVGSSALGCAQLQGVWLAPHLRGSGRSVPMIASVVEQLMAGGTPLVSLYVNGYNAPALAAYRAVGFATVGEFTTVLL